MLIHETNADFRHDKFLSPSIVMGRFLLAAVNNRPPALPSVAVTSPGYALLLISYQTLCQRYVERLTLKDRSAYSVESTVI